MNKNHIHSLKTYLNHHHRQNNVRLKEIVKISLIFLFVSFFTSIDIIPCMLKTINTIVLGMTLIDSHINVFGEFKMIAKKHL